MRIWMLPAFVLLVAAPLSAKGPGDVFSETPAAVAAPTHAKARPDGSKIGGDTIFDALEVTTVPFVDSGSTVGFANDYDAACPYVGGTAPDVVYSFTPAVTGTYSFDLCDSGYDTKIFLMDESLMTLACNDDYYRRSEGCNDWTSRIPDYFLPAGTTVYVVVDGYGSESGDYTLTIDEAATCAHTCPPEAVAEGEPPLASTNSDTYNSGCRTTAAIFQTLTADENGDLTFCLNTGWRSSGGYDTDWLLVTAGDAGTVGVTLGGRYAMIILAAGRRDLRLHAHPKRAFVSRVRIGRVHHRRDAGRPDPAGDLPFLVGHAERDRAAGVRGDAHADRTRAAHAAGRRAAPVGNDQGHLPLRNVGAPRRRESARPWRPGASAFVAGKGYFTSIILRDASPASVRSR